MLPLDWNKGLHGYFFPFFYCVLSFPDFVPSPVLLSSFPGNKLDYLNLYHVNEYGKSPLLCASWEDHEGTKLGHKYMGLSQKSSLNRYTAKSGKGTHEQVFNCSLFT